MKNDRAIRYARGTAIAIGVAHFALMLFFYNGPELAPLVVCWVDFPVYWLISVIARSGCDDRVALIGSMVICSFIYPAILYSLFKLVWRLSTRRRIKCSIPNG